MGLGVLQPAAPSLSILLRQSGPSTREGRVQEWRARKDWAPGECSSGRAGLILPWPRRRGAEEQGAGGLGDGGVMTTGGASAPRLMGAFLRRTSVPARSWIESV